MKFSGAVGCILGRSDYFGTNCSNYPQESEQCKKWVLGGGFFYIVQPLVVLFHSDNLVEME